MTRARIMHLIDALDAGGAERVAVNLVNMLPRDRYEAVLCTTRRDGVLGELVADHVRRICLNRRGRLDLHAVATLAAYIRQNGIQILHAHETSLFIATAAALVPPYPAVVWHDHFGFHGVRARQAWLYRPFARHARAVIAVNGHLAAWSRERLGVAADRVTYVPNFVAPPPEAVPAVELPGNPGRRVVCVANFRRQKDHLTLVRAMAVLVRELPDVHLLLVGEAVDPACESDVRAEVAALDLGRAITFLGGRRDVWSILRGVDVGVLSSSSEGLPLALIEYGMAGLPVVATSVGQCPDVLDRGSAGVLVPPASPAELGGALRRLLERPDERSLLAHRLSQRVRRDYTPDKTIAHVSGVYERVLREREELRARAA